MENLIKARELLKANRAAVDDSIAKLSAEAQVAAKKMRDLFMDEAADPSKMMEAADTIRNACSPAVIVELEEHRKVIAAHIGAAF